jgi:hypothetical protein
MNAQTKKYSSVVSVLVAGALLSTTIASYAQTGTSTVSGGASAMRGITFPVADLGGCASQSECRTYCNDSAHIEACTKFAETHGLMNKDEASRARKFASALQTTGGPGRCTTPESCKTFCANIENLEACTKFAEAQGIKDENVTRAKKVADFLKSGGTMPGGCTSQDSCRTYCNDFSHATECLAFMKSVGVGSSATQGQGGAMQKILELAQSGETPGGCTSKDACEAYCHDTSHAEECRNFAVKAGFINADQANLLKQAEGKGPGGCTSKDACKAYCNDQAHRDECFAFAETHGLINKEDASSTKDGLVRLRVGLENASPEVSACITSALGQSTLDDIQSGKLVPAPEVGMQIRGCFEKFGQKEKTSDLFKKVPLDIKSCLKEKLGSDFAGVTSGKIDPTPEAADGLRMCATQVRLEQGGGFGSGQNASGTFGAPMVSSTIVRFLRSAPPEVAQCAKEKLGDDLEKTQSGEVQSSTSAGAKIKECFESFRPIRMMNQMGTSTNSSSGFEGRMNVPRPGFFGNVQLREGEGSGTLRNVSGTPQLRPRPLPNVFDSDRRPSSGSVPFGGERNLRSASSGFERPGGIGGDDQRQFNGPKGAPINMNRNGVGGPSGSMPPKSPMGSGSQPSMPQAPSNNQNPAGLPQGDMPPPGDTSPDEYVPPVGPVESRAPSASLLGLVADTIFHFFHFR